MEEGREGGTGWKKGVGAGYDNHYIMCCQQIVSAMYMYMVNAKQTDLVALHCSHYLRTQHKGQLYNIRNTAYCLSAYLTPGEQPGLSC